MAEHVRQLGPWEAVACGGLVGALAAAVVVLGAVLAGRWGRRKDGQR